MRRRRILLLFAGFLSALFVATYLILRHTGASRAFVEGALARFIRSDFGLRDADVDPTSGVVRLHGIHIAHPRNEEQQLLAADRIELDVSTNPLGSHMGEVRAVRISRLDLQISLAEGEGWSWTDVVELPTAEGDEPPAELPALQIEDSRLSVRLAADGPSITFTEVELSVLPEAGSSSRRVITGTMHAEAGFDVTVSGSGDPTAPEFQLLVQVDDVDLRPELVQPYGATIERFLAESEFTGKASRLALWLQYPTDAGEPTVGARLRADIEGVDCRPTVMPYPVRNATGTITASSADGGSVRFELESKAVDRSIEARGELTALLDGSPLIDVRVLAKDVPIDDDLRSALFALRESRTVWQALEPQGGRASADLLLHNDEPGRPPKVSMDLDVDGASCSFEGFPTADGSPGVRFPYRIDNLHGLVQLRPGRVTIHDATGQRDGGQLALSGTIGGLGRPGLERVVSLDITGNDLEFSDELRDAVAAVLQGGGRTYDLFAPRGRCDTDVRVRKAAGTNAADVDVTLRPAACSVTYRGFPYELNAVNGIVKLDRRGLSFDLTGAHGEAKISVGGRYLLAGDEAGLQSDLWVRGEQVQLDADLLEPLSALGPDIAKVWQTLEPRGLVDCQVGLWRQTKSDTFEHDLRVDFDESSVRIPGFGLRLNKLSGPLFIHGSGPQHRLAINYLHGEVANGDDAEPSRVVMKGTAALGLGDGDDTWDLTTVVRGVPLDRSLAERLQSASLLDLATWDMLQPAGTVDLVNRTIRDSDDETAAQTTRVVLRGVRSQASFLPYEATNLHGEVIVRDGAGSFAEILGALGDTQIALSAGSFGLANGRSFFETTLSADDLTVDANFAKLLTGPMRETFLARNLDGSVRLEDLTMRYEFPGEDAGGSDDFELSFSGRLHTKALSMQLVAPIRDINGAWDISRGRVTPAGGEVRCSTRNVSFDAVGHRCSGFDADVLVSPTEVAFRELTLGLHGGRVEGSANDGEALVYDLERNVLRSRLSWRGIRLSDLLQAANQPSTTTRGTVAGSLELEHDVGRGAVATTASGRVKITNGRLGEVPMFTAIYSYLAPKNRPQFDGVSLDFDLRDRLVQIRNLVVSSPLVQVTGGGTVNFDGYLDVDLEFPDLFASAADWLILPRVLNVLTSQVVRFHVFGWLRAPQARPRWLFENQAQPQPIAPIPLPTRRRPTLDF
ncbi:MAG: AsmA-like C-terminal region-containing protein [Planctomycetota bacterium]